VGKRKGFTSRPNIDDTPTLDRLESIATTEPRLEILLVEIVKYGLSQRCHGSIKHLATMPPRHRLAVNLKTCLNLMANKGVDNVLQDGLTPDELDALKEIDSSAMTTESRRTAHSLMDIEARIKLVSTFQGLLNHMQTRKQHMLESRPLDE